MNPGDIKNNYSKTKTKNSKVVIMGQSYLAHDYYWPNKIVRCSMMYNGF